MKKIFFFAFTLMVLCLNAQIEIAYSDFIGSTALQNAHVGVSFVDVADGKVIFAKNEQQFFYPASVQKTITTGVALRLLGSDFRYETKVAINGSVENGVLKGNVIISASGDPTTNSKHFNNDLFNQLITKLKDKGIHTIQGNVVVNGEASHNTPQTWLFEDVGNYYGAAPQLFNFKENMYTISFQQVGNGQQPSIKKLDIPVPYKFDLHLICSSERKGDHSYIIGAPFSLEREVVGTISSGTGIFEVKGANAHPQYTFKEALSQEFAIEYKEIKAGWELESVGIFKSSDLKSICRVTNHESVNLFAEGVLNTLGLTFKGKYSTEAGIEVIENFVKESKADSKQIVVKDGSGLSRLNAMTPNFAANWMCDYFENKDFLNTLPISGTTGTMQYLNHVGIKGKVQAKSGSAEGVINYAGYIYLNNGKTYAFSIFVNNAFQSRYSIRREIGVFLEKVLYDQ